MSVNCNFKYFNKSINIKNDCSSCLGKYHSGETLLFSDTFPKEICPFLYQASLPYILTFAGGGWFKWSLDKNEVDAQCPFPNGIKAKIIRNTDGDKIKIAVSVTYCSSDCPRGHKKGDLIELFPFKEKHCPHLFQMVFSNMVSSTPNEMVYCLSPKSKVGLEIKFDGSEMPDEKVRQKRDICISKMNNGCAYYRKIGTCFNSENLFKNKICQRSFYLMYPYFLSLLYDGKSGDFVFDKIRCSCERGEVLWNLKTKSYIFKPIFNFFEKFLRKIKKPYDFVDKKIIVSQSEEELHGKRCQNKCQPVVFDHYKNYFNKKTFCPALFYHLYPLFFSDNADSFKEVICPSVESCIIAKRKNPSP